MPDHQKSTPQSPKSAREVVWRETFVSRFDSPEDAQSVRLAGEAVAPPGLGEGRQGEGERSGRGGCPGGSPGGANDNAKGVATLIGAGRLGPRSAIRYGTAMTLLGSAVALPLAGGLLARFGGKGIVAPELARLPAFALVVAAAAATVLLATGRWPSPASQIVKHGLPSRAVAPVAAKVMPRATSVRRGRSHSLIRPAVVRNGGFAPSNRSATASRIPVGAEGPSSVMPFSWHSSIRRWSTELMIFSTMAASGLLAWLPMMLQLLSLSPNSRHDLGSSQ